MATWKKIIVSGSVAELAAVSASVGVLVGTNQQIQPTHANTRLTGSFTGSFTGDGTGLTGVTATATFPSTAKTTLAGSDKFFVNDDAGDATSGNKKITLSNLLTDIAGDGLSAVGGETLNVNFPSGTVSGSSFSSPSQGTVRATINGVNTDVDTGLQTGDSPTFVDVTLTGDITVGGNDIKMNGGTTALTFSGTGDVEVAGDLKVTGNDIKMNGGTTALTFSGTGDVEVAGDLKVTGNDIKMNGGTTALTFSGTGDVEVAGDLKVTGNDIKSSGGTTAITLNGANVTVAGDLTVNGTTTTLDTTNLLVEDQFALFASGSDGNTDGGIIVQQGSTTGYALGVDASADRWALQNNLAPSGVSSITPDAFMGVIQQWTTGNQPPAPQYGGATAYGTIGVEIDTKEVYIWVG